MNKELIDTLIKYSKNHDVYSNFISTKSKENLIAILTDLITITINDKNSSNLREMITAIVSGYIPNEEKIGYNGYKILHSVKTEYIEIKPKNIYTKKDGKLNAKLDGSGNFTDFRWFRFNKLKDDNINMVISGFSHGKLIYVLRFPFNFIDFTDNLERQLIKKFPDGDVKSNWLRSATFGFKNYKNSTELEIIYKTIDLENHKSEITKDLYEFLAKK